MEDGVVDTRREVLADMALSREDVRLTRYDNGGGGASG
jgi:hypothetical protein